MDITDTFVYQNNVWDKTECEFLVSVFHNYRDNRNSLSLFFGEHPFKNDLTKIKQTVQETLEQESLLYLSRENVDILNGKLTLYNMCVRKIIKTEKQLGKVVFKNDNEIYSVIKFVFCLKGSLKMTVLNKNITIEPGQIVLFPSSWIFPYGYILETKTSVDELILIEGYCFHLEHKRILGL